MGLGDGLQPLGQPFYGMNLSRVYIRDGRNAAYHSNVLASGEFYIDSGAYGNVSRGIIPRLPLKLEWEYGLYVLVFVQYRILLKLSSLCLPDHVLVGRNVDLYAAVLGTSLFGSVVGNRHVE